MTKQEVLQYLEIASQSFLAISRALPIRSELSRDIDTIDLELDDLILNVRGNRYDGELK